MIGVDFMEQGSGEEDVAVIANEGITSNDNGMPQRSKQKRKSNEGGVGETDVMGGTREIKEPLEEPIVGDCTPKSKSEEFRAAWVEHERKHVSKAC